MPPIGGRNTRRSGRVTSSGYMPPVCSNSVAAQAVLGGAEARRDARQIPDRIDRRLDHRDVAIVVDDLAVDLEPLRRSARRAFRPWSSRARVMAMVGRISRPSAISGLNTSATRCPTGRARRSSGLGPLRERSDGGGGMGVGQVGPPDRVERARRHGERAIKRIGAAVSADHVALAELRHGADDRAALARRGRAPMDREARLRPWVGMPSEPDMIRTI